jgi:hypothetical protein
VFRAATLSVVLTLAAAPNAAVVCSVWCHPQGATTPACEHEPASTPLNVGDRESCTIPGLSTAAFLREDVWRGPSAPDSGRALMVPVIRLSPPASSSDSGRERSASVAPRARSPVRPLRL